VHTPKSHRMAQLWPGLPHLWNQGSWVGLALAVGFTVLLNTLLATLVFREWMVDQVRWAACGALLVIWLLAWWENRTDGKAEDDGLFREAQQSYLAADWVTTEKLLLELLRKNSRDVEGRLMLATLWQHQGRKEEALGQLEKIQQLETAEKWQYEINALQKSLVSDVRNDEATDELPDEPTEATNRHLAA